MGKQVTGQELKVQTGEGVGAGVQEGGGQPVPTALPAAPAIAGAEGAPGAQAPEVTPGAQPAGGTAGVQGTPSLPQTKPVDLSQYPEFRKFQAERDRREAQLRSELDQIRTQVQEQQRRADELAVQGMDPEQQAEYYRQQNASLVQQQQQAMLQQEERRRIAESVYADLQELGIAPDDPGLAWPEEQTWETAKQIVSQAAKLSALRAQTVASEQTTQAAQAAREAGQQALVQAGVTRVAPAGGAAPAAPNPLESITDPDTLLDMAMGGGGKKR